jgi:hypothetical protein
MLNIEHICIYKLNLKVEKVSHQYKMPPAKFKLLPMFGNTLVFQLKMREKQFVKHATAN